MFAADRWAAAFLKLLEKAANADSQSALYDAGLAVIKAAALNLAGKDIRGSADASQFNGFLRSALKKAGYTEQNVGVESACAVVFLLIQKGYVKKIDLLSAEIESEIQKKNHIVQVIVETAHPLDDVSLQRLKEKLTAQTGALKIIFLIRNNPELIGGYRLTMDSERQDYSLSGELKQLSAVLSAQ